MAAAFSAAAGAGVGMAANKILDSLGNGASAALNSISNGSSAAIARYNGTRYKDVQKKQLLNFGMLLSSHCSRSAPEDALNYFKFNDEEECPVKVKSHLWEGWPRLDNIDTPSNLSKERRSLVHCVDRAHTAMLNAEIKREIHSPDVYFMGELRRWSRSVPVEPSRDLVELLDQRCSYVETASKLGVDIARKHMGELLRSMKALRSGCRNKLAANEKRQLLPRIHGEANSMCERMQSVFALLLEDSQRNAVCSSSMELTDSDAQAAETLLSFSSHVSMHSIPEEQVSVPDLLKALRKTNLVIQDKNHKLGLLLVHDGLPIDCSICSFDTVRELLLTLQDTLKSADEDLKRLETKYDAWSNATCNANPLQVARHRWRRDDAIFRHWKEHQDEISYDIKEIYNSEEQCSSALQRLVELLKLSYAEDAKANCKRAISLSPPLEPKRLKQD